jgi:hypothetical protein
MPALPASATVAGIETRTDEVIESRFASTVFDALCESVWVA